MATLRPQEQASGKYLCLDGELGRFFFTALQLFVGFLLMCLLSVMFVLLHMLHGSGKEKRRTAASSRLRLSGGQ